MLDPNPIQAPAALQAVSQKVADFFGLPTLPLHAHEVLFALAMYTFIANVVSPIISTRLFPEIYPKFSKRTKISWDVHVVSFVQSCVINSLSLYVMFFDEERKTWRSDSNWEKRIWGYDGMSGLLQSQALGYFLWDLYMCTRYVHIFGWGMLAHAISAVTVFSFGFRPFLYFYAPVFLLYELSSPFLNIHWFCDKLNLTGSVYQAVNGAFLTTTFFCCRIIWGNYSSIMVFKDVYRAITEGYTTPKYFMDKFAEFPHHGDLNHPLGQTTAFMEVRYLPLWLGASYLASNITLNLLNIFWFSKMIQTIRTRFPPPYGTKGTGKEVHYHPQEKPAQPVKQQGSVRAARERAEEIMEKNPEQAPAADGFGNEPVVQRSLYDDGHKGVEVTGSTTSQRVTRSRRRG